MLSTCRGVAGDVEYSCIKFDLKTDGPLEFLRRTLTADQEYDAFRTIHGPAFGIHDIIVFSEVRGPLVGLMRLATEHKYSWFRTNQDEQGFAMMVFWSPRITVPLAIMEYKIDLRSIYANLHLLQQKQIEIGVVSTDVEIGGITYRLDLCNFDFTKVPPVRHGLHVGSARIYQYIPPGPPNPTTRATILAKLMYLDGAVTEAILDEYAYIGNANLPPDLAILAVDGTNVNAGVLKSHAPVATPLNDGETIRLTVLDILGRRKLGILGWKQDLGDDDAYLRANIAYRNEFDFAHNCPTARAEFGPPCLAFEQIKDRLWDPLYVQAVRDARQRDQPRQYTEINKLWAALPQYLLDRGIDIDAIVSLIYQEDHVRISWTM